MTRLKKSIRQEIDFVNRILIGLHERSYKTFWEEGGAGTRKGLESILQKLQPFASKEWLERSLPSDERREGKLLNSSHLLFLDFVKKENALPILDMKWDLERHPEVEIRFRFFLLHWENIEERPRAVGFRLESPEGMGTERGDGNHDYWHAQMIAEFEKGDDLIKKLIGDQLPRWIPAKQPAIPLPAKKMGDLLAVLLLSLYGVRQLETFRDLEMFGDLKNRLRTMNIPLS